MRGRIMRSRAVRRLPALTMLLVLFAPLLAGCSAPSFGSSFASDLKFGDDDQSSTIDVARMGIPAGGLGKGIGQAQLDKTANWIQYKANHFMGVYATPQDYLKANPQEQCRALNEAEQDADKSQKSGKWDTIVGGNGVVDACVKRRELSWLERTLWHMYDKQANGSLDWLSTSRNTLTASASGIAVLKASGGPDSSDWDAKLQPYINAAQGVLLVVGIVSLTVVFASMVARIRSSEDDDGRVMSKAGWVFLGVFLGSTAVTIGLRLFARANGSTPGAASWDPNGGATYFVSDWVRAQLDPIYIIAIVVGIIAAGFKLATRQEGRELVPAGRALLTAAVTSFALAGLVNTLNVLFDSWSSGLMRAASSLMSDAWSRNALQASDFFKLDAPVAVVLVILMWLMGMVAKIFAYFRSGFLPIMVGIAPTWAALSYSNEGRQAFGRTLGWLVAFLAYKPVAALTLATGSAIMVSAGPQDDSMAITMMMTLAAIIVLPALIKTVVPLSSLALGGGGGAALPAMLGGAATIAGAGATLSGHGFAGLIGRLRGHSTGGGSKGPDGASPTRRPGPHAVPPPGPAPDADRDVADPAMNGPDRQTEGSRPGPGLQPQPSPAAAGTDGRGRHAMAQETPSAATGGGQELMPGATPDGADMRARRRKAKEF
jgi:hypothetical protein